MKVTNPCRVCKGRTFWLVVTPDGRPLYDDAVPRCDACHPYARDVDGGTPRWVRLFEVEETP